MNPEEQSGEVVTSRIQIVTLIMALKTAVRTEGRMHLTNPAHVRRCALHILTPLGYPVSNRTKWLALLWWTQRSFRATLDEGRCVIPCNGKAHSAVYDMPLSVVQSVVARRAEDADRGDSVTDGGDWEHAFSRSAVYRALMA